MIPFWHGEMLMATANDPKSSFWIEEAKHNDVFSINKIGYLQAIRDFADNLPK